MAMVGEGIEGRGVGLWGYGDRIANADSTPLIRVIFLLRTMVHAFIMRACYFRKHHKPLYQNPLSSPATRARLVSVVSSYVNYWAWSKANTLATSRPHCDSRISN